MSRMEIIEKYLGKAFYKGENCLIYNMDCVEAMAALSGEVFNLVLTSPPYNIGKEYEMVREIQDYLNWCELWIDQVYNLTVKNGSFWLNLGYLSIDGKAKAIPIPYLLWNKIPYYMIQEIVWHYTAGVSAKKYYSPRNEKLIWYVKNAEDYTFNLDDVRDPNVKYPNQKKNGKLKVNPLGKNPSDVWIIPKITSGEGRSSSERTAHPAQFPRELVKRVILASSNLGDIVLDPFMGSGTTAEVALLLGRQVVGFETRRDYCEIIKSRIINTQNLLL